MATGIVLLAGSSTRYNSNRPKQFELVNNRPIFDYSISAFIKSPLIEKIVLVTRKDYLDYVRKFYKDESKIIGVIEGGVTRQTSVLLALEFLDGKIDGNEKILIQDAARPFLSSAMIENSVKTLDEYDSCTSASRNKDTLCQSSGEFIDNYVDRTMTFCIETPQGFIYKKLFEAHKRMDVNLYTDDTQLLKSIGIQTKLIISDEVNFKITTLSDMELFKKICEEEE